ncbi:hypothetical protein CAEBREN_09771 [Caenorhabditis brenneri]|uniref:Uncharacterized protein n=1 Tax=Caenorhabditis brenneri TaxID=135651 RepID=G0MZE1_CAEBE|nr:hypothetical protein CAEBREN_09771 [Caenorhabditis brenneri]
MKLFVVLVLLALSQFGATSLMRNWMHDFESQLPMDSEDDIPLELGGSGLYGFKNMMARSRRSNKIKMCGGKVWKMVMLTCGGECTTVDSNIATTCCENMCTMEELSGLCCPKR